ncbi:unnamed protein product [Vitrella brassicaformis CCMP3155]|uniref:Uncharacterized protein n=1 Tax=Vitrella brassicaformis (strain CCMP3155) TaxID=1169540 RepID=A0A0G4GZ84_VITBC|nr:unnamed protein product [Vitrella brassicaformis CCMP3155]|eukprot:CEM36263.1 unnamed protein product [Vitrella brassicaformis CCMP3155]
MAFDFGDVPKHPSQPNAPRQMRQRVIDALSTYVLSAPAVPINVTCAAPSSYTELRDDDCTANDRHTGLLSGKRLDRPRKMVDMFYFGFDLDTAEVRFNELRHAVDWFVVGESRMTSTGRSKPLLMTRALQDPEWFGDLRDRIISIELPESVMRRKYENSKACQEDGQDCWEPQMWARNEIVKRFLQLNEEMDHKYVSLPEDLVFMSDPDEIPAGEVMKLVKHCELTKPLQDAALVLISWAGNFNIVFTKMMDMRPLISRLPHASAPRGMLVPFEMVRSRRMYFYRRQVQPKLYGGWHITDYNFIPFLFVKYSSYGDSRGRILRSESCMADALFGDPPDELPSDLQANLNKPLSDTGLRDLEALRLANLATARSPSWKPPRALFNEMAARLVWAQRRLYTEGYSRQFLNKGRYERKHELGEKYDKLKRRELPWFVKCNPHRFPVLFGNADPRYFQEDRGQTFQDGQPSTVSSMEEWSLIMRWNR